MDGYTTIPILGKTRGIKFGALAAEQIMIELSKLGTATNGYYSNSMIAVVIYWGLFNNAYVKRDELDITFEQVVDWVDEHLNDEASAKAFTDVVLVFESSKSTKLLAERVSEIVEKKTRLTSEEGKDGTESGQ